MILVGWTFWLEEHVEYDLLQPMMSNVNCQIYSPYVLYRMTHMVLPISCSGTFGRSTEGFELEMSVQILKEFVHDRGFV